jgi:hypothetical protein
VNTFFSMYLILPAGLGPGVYSASNRNEYQKQKKMFLGVKRGRYVGLTTLMPPVSLVSNNVDCETMGAHGSVAG